MEQAKAAQPRLLAGKTAVIAGSGILPLAVAERLAAQGAPLFVAMLHGNADEALAAYPHGRLGVADLGKLLRLLRAEKIDNVILAGGIAKRPHLRNLRWDWASLKALPHIFAALRRGDDALLRAFIRVMEGYGFHIIGAHEIVPELVAPPSGARGRVLTRRKANKAERADIALAAEAARLLGRLDIGQGAVAVCGRVVAVEGAEGTDAMLERVAHLRKIGKIPPKGGVLVKMKKPNQEMRADLPAIGPQTIANISKAGLAGMALEAGGSLILQAEDVAKQADAKKLFLQSF